MGREARDAKSETVAQISQSLLGGGGKEAGWGEVNEVVG